MREPKGFDTGVAVSGLDELRQAFEKMLQDFPEKKQLLMDEVGDILVDEIQKETPEKTGRLKRSIRKKVKPNYVVVKSSERYAHLVEAGHVVANEKMESSRAYKRGKKKGQYKKVAKPIGFTKGRFMFKKGTAAAKPRINKLLDKFARNLTGEKT